MRKAVLVDILVILSLCAIVVLTPIIMLMATFGKMSEETEMYRVESPDGSRYAVVIESDQGALGGATWVDVVEKPGKFLFFTIRGSSQRVYVGRWGEHDSIRVTWRDADTLLINGEAYPIK